MIKVSDNETEYNARKLIDLLEIFQKFKPTEYVGGWLYRGQSDSSWSLIPKAGREIFYEEKNQDLARFSVWKKELLRIQFYPKKSWKLLLLHSIMVLQQDYSIGRTIL